MGTSHFIPAYAVDRPELRRDLDDAFHRSVTVVVAGAGSGGDSRNRQMKTPIVIAALAVALLLQSTIAGMSFTAASRVNLVLVAVIYVGLAYGAVTRGRSHWQRPSTRSQRRRR